MCVSLVSGVCVCIKLKPVVEWLPNALTGLVFVANTFLLVPRCGKAFCWRSVWLGSVPEEYHNCSLCVCMRLFGLFMFSAVFLWFCHDYVERHEYGFKMKTQPTSSYNHKTEPH